MQKLSDKQYSWLRGQVTRSPLDKMMRGATWLFALAAARGVAGVTDGAGCGAPFGNCERKPRDAAAAPWLERAIARAYVLISSSEAAF